MLMSQRHMDTTDHWALPGAGGRAGTPWPAGHKAHMLLKRVRLLGILRSSRCGCWRENPAFPLVPIPMAHWMGRGLLSLTPSLCSQAVLSHEQDPGNDIWSSFQAAQVL